MFFSRQFFFEQCRKSQQGNPSVLCFRKLLVAKFFMDKKGGISRVSVENFLSDSAEKFRSGTPQCVINFGYRKILCFRGLCNDFLSKMFCLTVPKHFVAETLCAVFQRKCSCEKVYGQEGVGVSSFSVNVFLSDSAGKFRSGTPFCAVFQKNSCSKKNG